MCACCAPPPPPPQVSKSHVVYPGLGHIFSAGQHIHNPIDIPGVREAGWNVSHMTGISQVPVCLPCLVKAPRPMLRGWKGRDRPSDRALVTVSTIVSLSLLCQRDTERERQALSNALHQAFKEVKGHRASWPFLEPVDTDEVNDYLDVITDPIGE